MNAPVQSNQKAALLQNTVEHVDMTSFDARPIIDSMRKMSFSSRDTARAADIMTVTPVRAHAPMSLGEAARIMEDRPSQISVLPVTDAATNRCLGLIRIHDIYQAGIV